jgi:hypothetical protein
MNSIDSLGLSLSMVCGASCVFCPRPNTGRNETPFMSPELVEKILDESEVYGIASIDVGENGDAFLNPDALEILRLIRSKSTAALRMFTNFRSFRPGLIDTVLEEGLLDTVVTNIDGATPEAYRAVKGLELDRVEGNILHFLARKEALESPVQFRIQALTLNHYVTTVRRVLGRDPTHVPEELVESADDFEEIVARWREHGVFPERSIVTLWAEDATTPTEGVSLGRAAHRLRRQLFPKPCRMLEKIERGLFVAASGQVYLCCADFDCEIVLGDLNRQTVREVVESEKRKDILTALRKRRFHEIGGPCSHPELCRVYR